MFETGLAVYVAILVAVLTIIIVDKFVDAYEARRRKSRGF
jgi:hypothetical protein